MPHKDPAERREYMRRWKAENRATHRELTRLYDKARHANQRAAAQGVIGTITTADVRAILAANKCHYCDRSDVDLTIDHVIPLARGGANARSNLAASCLPCNKQKARKLDGSAWAEHYERCVGCATTDRPHLARGHCASCYNRTIGSRAARRARAS
jgi:5-methylcytosine-specific restriction endonuclease McrA